MLGGLALCASDDYIDTEIETKTEVIKNYLYKEKKGANMGKIKNDLFLDLPFSSDEWKQGLNILKGALAENNIISTNILRKKIKEAFSKDMPELFVALSYYSEENRELYNRKGYDLPDFAYIHSARSLYLKDSYNALEKHLDNEISQEVEAVEKTENIQEIVEPPIRQKQNRQEEARMCVYIKKFLEKIYASEHIPPIDNTTKSEHIFDVHNDRSGSVYENVDVLGIYWTSKTTIEIITVEAKLKFTADAVQQAVNYQRFSNRVWVAVPIEGSDIPGSDLQEQDMRLWDYVIQNGLGILGCYRRQGGKYDIMVIQWPQYSEITKNEKNAMMERYEKYLIEARVSPAKDMQFPSID